MRRITFATIILISDTELKLVVQFRILLLQETIQVVLMLYDTYSSVYIDAMNREKWKITSARF